MKNKNTYIINGRTFEVVTVMVAGFKGALAESYIYEVIRPSWKIFRTRIIDSKSFWIDEYDTIEQGVKKMLALVLKEEGDEIIQRLKWQDFEKN